MADFKPIREYDGQPDHLKALRERTKLTQKTFGGMIGMKQHHYSDAETGKHPPTNIQIAAANMATFIVECGLLGAYTRYLNQVYPGRENSSLRDSD